MPDNNSAPAVSMASRALGNPWAGFILALVVIVLDQYTKMWASNELVYRVPVEITSWFDLMLAHNTVRPLVFWQVLVAGSVGSSRQ